MTSGPWAVHHARGTAAELHAGSSDVLAGHRLVRTVRVLEVTGPAVVLGSAEPDDHVDRERARRRGVEVARRRSGGAAVLVGPEEVLWADLVLPRCDVLWSDDVGRAMWWVGEAWAGALEAAGAGPVAVWRGPFRSHPWSDRVCFAGVGAGEVVAAGVGAGEVVAAGVGAGEVGAAGVGPKLVGISQRRTRAGALFQCAALLRWRPDDLLDVLALDARRRERGVEELAGVAAGVGAGLGPALLEALLSRLPR